MKQFCEFGLNVAKIKKIYLKEGFRFLSIKKKKIKSSDCILYKEMHVVKESLLKEIYDNIRNQIELSTYRGYRHYVGLPVNGQNTHKNRKTQRILSKKRIIF